MSWIDDLRAAAEAGQEGYVGGRFGLGEAERLRAQRQEAEQRRLEMRLAQERERRAAAADERAQQAADLQIKHGKLSLADQLAGIVANMGEGQGSQGQPAPVTNIGGGAPEGLGTRTGGYDVTEPSATGMAPDYRKALPSDMVGATGLSPEAIVSSGLGRLAGSRRQLKILSGEQAQTLQRGRQTWGTGERTGHEAFLGTEGAANRQNRLDVAGVHEAGKDRRHDARPPAGLGKALGGAQVDDARALRDLQAGKIIHEQYLQRLIESGKRVPDPFDSGPDVTTPTNYAPPIPKPTSETDWRLPATTETQAPSPDAGHGSPVARRKRPDGTYEYRDSQGNVWSE